MRDQDKELQERIMGLSDASLRRMVTSDAKDYRPEALTYANEELMRRGLEPGSEAGESQEPDVDCLRCKSKMAFAGKRRFYDGPRVIGGIVGAILDANAKPEEFDLWKCSKCGHVELFTEPTD